jgi:hypothetical protein
MISANVSFILSAASTIRNAVLAECPACFANLAGTSLGDPEVAVVANPASGTWTVLVSGSQVNTATDKFELRISLDGRVLKIN